ncbi:MAG: thiamine phosphate synthase [Paracoccaceae bacterium]
MTSDDMPQIYLFTPPAFDLNPFAEQMARVLDTHTVACVGLSLATRDEDTVSRAADTLREITHARDIALVVTDHVQLAQRLGLDGVHLSDPARMVRDARKELGEDAIVGAFCGTSRHDGMSAGEAGADYISFGPVEGSGLGDGSVAERDLFEWWSEMIELPVVAQGGLSEASVNTLTPVVDFFAFGEEVWLGEDPVAKLGDLIRAMG